jgi:hypothetical protein
MCSIKIAEKDEQLRQPRIATMTQWIDELLVDVIQAGG